MASIHQGYRGILVLGANLIRFTDCGITSKQGVEIPDVVMGDYRRNVWAYGKGEVGGGLSGIMDTDFVSSIWNWAYVRDTCGLLSGQNGVLWYYCDAASGKYQSFVSLFANSVTLSTTAGDPVNWSVETVGAGAPTYGLGTAPSKTNLTELVMWNDVQVSINGVAQCPVQSFELTITNNCEPVYAICSSSLSGRDARFPYVVVPGIRTVNGSFTFYDVRDDVFTDNVGPQTISVSFGSLLTVTGPAVLHRVEPKMGVGTVTSTVAFSGVGW